MRVEQELLEPVRAALGQVGKAHGLLGQIFRKAQNKIHEPAMLRRLIADLIDKENWSSLGVDVKGSIYEELLERNALLPSIEDPAADGFGLLRFIQAGQQDRAHFA